MAGKPTTIDEYLATVSDDKRAALEKLRQTIKAAAPKAEECISYALPAFRLNGVLVGFGATATHCAFYLFSGSMVEAHEEELKGYDTSKGTIRFKAEKPLPATLVRKLVKARIAENEELRAKGGTLNGKKGDAKKSSAKEKGEKKESGKKMNVKEESVKKESGASQIDPAVDAFMQKLDHPLKKEIESVRTIILGVSPAIREGIKWNAPSFRTSEYFATVNLRSRESVQIVLHLGAKVREIPAKGLQIDDPRGLLKWLAKDRCMITLGAGREFTANRAALESIIGTWIEYV